MADLSLLKAEFDGGVFSDRRWYVAGFGRFWFSTKADAEEAIKMAQGAAQLERDDFRQRVIDAIP